MDISRLDHTDSAESERIYQLLQSSYEVEASLMGVSSFAPLQRTEEEVRAAKSSFYGCVQQNLLVAAAEIEKAGEETASIGSFVVHPAFFNRGIGSQLLQYVLSACERGPMTVSTAAANAPALALYEKHGFRTCGRWTAPESIEMVTLVADVSE